MVGAVRRAIESRYDGLVDVYEYQRVKADSSHLMQSQEQLLWKALRCRLSYQSIAAADEPGPSAHIKQSVKLFLSPERLIPPGCKLIVSSAGKTVTYACSGPPAVYQTHQEIPLTLQQEWA